ncbi:hypothetical protein AB0C33_02085 [Nonomuraea sp. NPDC048881]|uniref:hypothetical protein n=1 Tax=Nonomuraea sp. NPDC048881 TaxID=3155030 RepID=UPI00341078E3
MTGDLSPEGRAMDDHPDVNATLAHLAILVNDSMTYYQKDSLRTDTLWPILPALLGTAGNPFPRFAYLKALEVDIHETDPVAVGVWRYAERGRAGEWAAMHSALVDALRLAITMHHETYGTTPLTDYLPEHMERLNAFLSQHEGESMFSPVEAEALVSGV